MNGLNESGETDGQDRWWPVMTTTPTLLQWLDNAAEQSTDNHDLTKSLHRNAAARIRELEDARTVGIKKCIAIAKRHADDEVGSNWADCVYQELLALLPVDKAGTTS